MLARPQLMPPNGAMGAVEPQLPAAPKQAGRWTFALVAERDDAG